MGARPPGCSRKVRNKKGVGRERQGLLREGISGVIAAKGAFKKR